MYGTESLVETNTGSSTAPAVPARPARAIVSRATADDIPEIIKLECVRSRALTPESDLRQKGFISTKLPAEKLHELISNPDDLVLTARLPHSSKVAGALIVYGRSSANRTYPYLHPHTCGKNVCYVKSLVVSRAQEGRWIPAALLREFHGWLKARDISEVLTESSVAPENGPSLALIKRAKMVEIARIPDPEKQITWGLFSIAVKNG